MTDAERLAMALQNRSVPMASPTGQFIPTPPLDMQPQTSPYNPIGIGETALSIGTGALAQPIASIYGVGSELFGGDGKQAANRLAQALTYQPTTEYGQATSQAFGEFADKSGLSSLPPFLGLPAPRMGAGAAKFAAQEYGTPIAEKGLSMYEQGRLTPGMKPVSEMADTSYKGSHVAPNAETYGATLDNLTGIMPADVYSSKGIRLYGINDPAIDREWFAAAYRAKNKPDADVTIWRAVPKGVKDINSGDWVTTSQTYAKNHGENTLNGEYDLISSKVKANTLSSEGYPYEFGYNAPTNKVNETPLTSVKDISEKWNNQGVNLDVYASKDGSKINLSKIVIDPKQRNQGVGSQVMNDIIQQADNTNAIVTLSPSVDFGGTSVARLKNFYKKFGFVENKGRNKDLSISETMYRKPVQTLPTRKELLQQEFDKLDK